jgi:hypothetical protein
MVTFVAALEEAKLLCSSVLGTGTGMIIEPQGPLQINGAKEAH